MRVLLDTNVVLDVLLDRKPFSKPASAILSMGEQGRIQITICATAITTVFYLSAKALGAAAARKHVRELLSIVEIAAVGRTVLERALSLPIADYEDAVVAASAEEAGADAVITRDVRGFRGCPIVVHEPEEFLALVSSKG